MRGVFVVVFLSLLLHCTPVQGYKQVVFMHGILAGGSEFDHFVDLVEKYHPGTKTTKIDLYQFVHSLVDLWDQVKQIEKKVVPIFTDPESEGTILVCFSQGGPVCRGLLSTIEHNVETFISLSAPLAGQFGDSDYLRWLFPDYLKDSLYKLFYTAEGQKVSVANYWYDPHHYDLYQKFSNYLAVLNNESLSHHEKSFAYKANFLRLKNLVLVGGPDDGVITPWQSSHFGMFDTNELALPMTDQKWYKNDAFGLQTLDKRGAIHVHNIPGIPHIKWHVEDKIFECCVKPWLT